MKKNEIIKVILSVPYYSQRFDIKEPFWKPRSCGIVALSMAMEYLNQERKRHSLFTHSRSASAELRGFAHFASLRGDHAKITSKSLPDNWQAGVQRLVVFSLAQLINEGVAIGARDPKHGWIHDGLVALAKKHGFKKSFRKEFDVESRASNNAALSYMIELLKLGIPILVSMRFKSGGHLVLLTGYRYLGVRHLSGFFYHDPNAKSRKTGTHKYISTSEFLKKWKGRLIIVK